MLSAHRLISAATLALLSASSFATTVVYTSSAAFLPSLASGSYTESFTGVDPSSPAAFAGGAFAYTIASPVDLYSAGSFIETNLPNAALTISFTSGNVKAVGANFFAVNLDDTFQSVAMTVTLSDGTAVSFTPSTQSTGYRGFTSDLVITSLVISAPGASLYAALDNLTVGTTPVVTVPAVPEPTTWALMGLGLAGLAVARRRKA